MKDPRFSFTWPLYNFDKMIIVTRNTNDTAASMLKKHRLPNAYGLVAECYQSLIPVSLYADIRVVRYEDLYRYPLQVILSMFDFLELAMEKERARELAKLIMPRKEMYGQNRRP